jgi:hypothetical protein
VARDLPYGTIVWVEFGSKPRAAKVMILGYNDSGVVIPTDENTDGNVIVLGIERDEDECGPWFPPSGTATTDRDRITGVVKE